MPKGYNMSTEYKTVCPKDRCTGCNACLNSCKKAALRKEDSGFALNVYIDTEKCVGCGLCARVCPVVSGCSFREPLEWLQGISNDDTARKRSTSGGFAYELARAFTENGGYVASCCFSDGEFRFRITNSVSELEQFSGSKYVKSDTGTVFSEIKALLSAGERVLFIGLPCQSAGLQLFTGGAEGLYCADLICHGTPSVMVLDAYLGRHGLSRAEAKRISFRNGPKYELALDGRGFEKTDGCEMLDNTSDDYSDAFLKRLNHLEGCYTCIFKRPQRASDVSLGDAWGTQHGEEEMLRGISLALPTTEKGLELLSRANIFTEPIDRAAVLKTNDQVEFPMPKPAERDEYLKKALEA